MWTPYEVQVQITQGRATVVIVGLEDNASTPARVDAPQGIEFDRLSMFPVPKVKGTWQLFAKAYDDCGNVDQTGLNRQVTVR